MNPNELTAHECIRLRLPTHGGLMNWEFKRRGRGVNVQVTGRLIFSGTYLMVAAALKGHGLIWAPEDIVADHVAAGRLEKVLEDWVITYPGYHLYYANRRASPAVSLVAEALKHKGDR